MNKVSWVLYRLVLLPTGLYQRWGINIRQLDLLLKTKLIMDDRRPNTFQQTRIRKQKAISNALLGTMLLAVLMGFINLISFSFGKDEITQFSIFFMAFQFLLASILVTDFTSVLIDVRDNNLLLPRPVNDRTLLMAKLLHILVHLSRVIIPMALPAVVYLWIEHNWWAGISVFLLILLASLFTIFIVNAVYLLVLQVMAPEKFKSFIAWFQVIFVVFIYGGYQIFLRLTERTSFQQFSIAENSVVRVFPPYWYAKSWLTLNGAVTGWQQWFWVLLMVAASFGSVWIVIRWLAPAFNRKLSAIHGSVQVESMDASGKMLRPANKKKLEERLAEIFTNGQVSRAGFLFVWRWTGRNRGFRMRVFPTIGYLFVWIILMFLPSAGKDTSPSKFSSSDYSFIILIYMSTFVLISAIQQVSNTEEYKAAWIFYSSPLKQPGSLIRGGFIGLLCKFMLLIALALGITGLAWKGVHILPNFLLGISNQLVIALVIFWIGSKTFPASQPMDMNDRSGSFIRGLMLLFVTGIIGLIHFLIYRFTGVVVILTALSLLASWLMLRRMGTISWKEIKEST